MSKAAQIDVNEVQSTRYSKYQNLVNIYLFLPFRKLRWEPFLIADILIFCWKRLVAADSTPGNRPFIGALDNNNGVARFVNDSNASLDKNVLGVNYNGNGMVIGFYHP